MAYTEKEIRAFKLKDILNSRMSALKAASLLYESAGCDLGHPTDTVLGTADKYFKWVRKGQDADTAPTPSTGLGNTPGATLGHLPEPTLQQAKTLKSIYSRFPGVSEEEIKRAVLKWASEIYGVNKYPTKTESIDLFSGWYREKN